MKNKSLFEKIFNTICFTMILCLFIYAFAKFVIAKNELDDEGMFFWGLTITVTSGVIFILYLTFSTIVSIWSNDDKFITIYKEVFDDLIKSKEDMRKLVEQKEKEIKELKKKETKR